MESKIHWPESVGYRLLVEGRVQGVGFRPFVKRLAERFRLAGAVANTGGGVVIEVETQNSQLLPSFISALQTEAPPAAVVDQIHVTALGIRRRQIKGFEIVGSRSDEKISTILAPDLASCRDCLRELQDPSNRRYAYPFLNCTNCGPRFSIATAVPYDRRNTTMSSFQLCDCCEAEYGDLADRRFHAEPVACPECGPHVFLRASSAAALLSGDPIATAIVALERGAIVALRGLGGFQLTCDAQSVGAVRRIRERKKRSRKPFAVMMRDLATVEQHCFVSDAERDVLTSPAAPIVLLRCRPGRSLSHAAPGLCEIGVMLPYTPLHHLLFESTLRVLVMTSGNFSEEPIIAANDQALEKLSPVCDLLLLHNREVFMRVDDSVTRHAAGSLRILRRARGYAPNPIHLPFSTGEILACGADMKNTFCLARGTQAILSQHLGDMENIETLDFFEEVLQNFKKVYRIQPTALAHDLHPDYLSVRWAERQPLPKLAVQHHHAHIASCMAENGLDETVMGVALDGTGYGSDGQVWGGEVLLCDFTTFNRAAHFRYVPLIGGSQAIRHPWRVAAAHLIDTFGSGWRQWDLPVWDALTDRNWQSFGSLYGRSRVLTSSCGRLFDAVSALIGCCQENSYEGEAAMRLEAIALPPCDVDLLPLDFNSGAYPWIVDTRPLIRRIVERVANGEGASAISRDFHETIARTLADVCRKLRDNTGINAVCLSGGTFQNATLLSRMLYLLKDAGFRAFSHSLVPPGDGGISLGQAAILARALRGNE